MAKKATEKYYGTGRRKKSVARVYLVPGKGNVTINKRDIDEYFGLETLKVIVRQPLSALDAVSKYDVIVVGGGPSGVVPRARVADRPRNGSCRTPCRGDICDHRLTSNLALLPHHNFTLTLNRRSKTVRFLVGRICHKDILAFFERAIKFAHGKKLACAFQTPSRFFVGDRR